MCEECYSDENRITPLLNPLDCLENHTQYICGTCGRCICIEHDPNRGLQRWNFPFKSLEIAKYYLRTADYTTKGSCGIYEIENSKGRVSYKIFAGNEDLHLFLKKNKDKKCKQMTPVFNVGEYKEYPHAEIRKLTSDENIFCCYDYFWYNCTIYFSIANHYYRWRNQCVLIDSLVIQTDANSKQVADFALITFVQSLNLTDNQRHELISLLDDKYRDSSIMAIAAGNLSI